MTVPVPTMTAVAPGGARDGRPPPPVVALVCSAGGLNALTQILSRLPADFPGAVVALQHMDPLRPSLLVDILCRSSTLPVHFAEDGDLLEPGVVLVCPPGRHALVTDGSLRLIASGSVPPSRPSADLLLASLAVTAGPRAIAVVLSGAGHDGATGATAVHDLGGVVIASDLPSSTIPSMPLAAIGRDDVVDHVVPLDDNPALLVRLVGSAAD